MNTRRRAWAPLALLLLAADAARAQDATPSPAAGPARPAADAEALRRELSAAYHAAPRIVAAYEVRKTVGGVEQAEVSRFEAYREGPVSAAWLARGEHRALIVMGPDDGRMVVDGKVAMHITGVNALDAAAYAFNPALQRLSTAWGRPLPLAGPSKPGLSITLGRADEAGQFRVGAAAERDTGVYDPSWLLAEGLRDAVATEVDGGAAVRFERKDEVRVVRRADGMPDLWVLERPEDRAVAEVRRVESGRSRDAWASAVSEAQWLDPAGAESSTFYEVLRDQGTRWEDLCLRGILRMLATSWPEWSQDAARRGAAEAELRAAWSEARRILGLPAEPSDAEREALDAALREGCTPVPTPK